MSSSFISPSAQVSALVGVPPRGDNQTAWANAGAKSPARAAPLAALPAKLLQCGRARDVVGFLTWTRGGHHEAMSTILWPPSIATRIVARQVLPTKSAIYRFVSARRPGADLGTRSPAPDGPTAPAHSESASVSRAGRGARTCV
jgi:hypothetical protein